MKIVLATPLYPPEIGGPATYTKELESELPRQGVEVAVVKFSDVRRLPKLIRHIAYTWQVYRVARHADIIFAQDTVSCGLPALIASRLARIPFLVRVPGDHAWEQARQRFGVVEDIDTFQGKKYGIGAESLRGIQRFVVRHADRVIVPSSYFGRLVEGWGVAGAKLQVIYNGIRLPLPPAKSPQKAVSPCIVSVGRLVPWKGFGGLIELVGRMPKWHLVIVGDGPLRAALEERSRTLGLEERVHFTGSLPRAEVLGWYHVADVFVLNSSFESFSFQTLEAMAAGIPFIGTSIGSIPELVTDGVEGSLVAPNDTEALASSVESVLSSPDVWQKRVEAAQIKSKQFSIKKTTESLLTVLKEVV